jgi:cytidine deaminase
MQLEERITTQTQLKRMSDAAWEVREHAHVYGPTKVGAAVMTADGGIFVGCNVEHRFRSHDIHAEVNAIGSMVAAGHTDLVAVVIVAERERFTPCGACMDWIYQFGGPSCLVGFQSSAEAEIKMYDANELMPYYPA